MLRPVFCFLLSILSLYLFAQQPLTYYLPDIEYDNSIPSPQDVLGYQIGEWHISHDQQYMYMKQLAAASPRVQLVEYARSYEHRPLVYLIITSEENQGNLEAIKKAHVALSDGTTGNKNVSNMPVVLYQGFSIHGNEPSGGNAAPLVAYYLAAGKSAALDRLLKETVILLDPCYNPDGFHRFSTWANMHKNKNLTADGQDREYNESWPRGRTNHYWFDLNRDWLLVQHPESQGRIRVFHEWKPNVLTDHHEMGTNSTFFFMPGEPQRTNPITPSKNQDLTRKIGTYHAAALDKIGSLYYSEEGFDDFYYGKGSTYPDANGCIGILFEQASSRGHLQESVNGLLSFPFTIRNQITTALSTQKAGLEMREELLSFQQEFYKTAQKEAKEDSRKAFIFGDAKDVAKVEHLVEILQRHQIEVFQLGQRKEIKGQLFEPGSAYVVPLEQNQYRLIRGIFETMTTFNDVIFYDVSSWTLPLAFNIPYATLDKKDFTAALKGKQVLASDDAYTASNTEKSDYAYLFNWSEYYAPKALNYLLEQGLRAKVATEPFKSSGIPFDRGAILIPVANQEKSAEDIYALVKTAAEESSITIHKIETGHVTGGIDLGSSRFRPLERPRVLLLVGSGVSGYEAGEVWHLLDQRYDIEVVKTELGAFHRRDLSDYNSIVMVDGSYSEMLPSGIENLKDWVREGGTLITSKRAVSWANNAGLANISFKSSNKNQNGKASTRVERRPYGKLSRDAGERVIGGAIFEARLDLSHPIAYGFSREKLPVFKRGTMAMLPSKNAYATPSIYTSTPLISGYSSKDNIDKIRNTAAIIISGLGRGKVICFADNPNFRAFWFGTNKLFANALFFGSTISSSAVEKVNRPQGPTNRRE